MTDRKIFEYNPYIMQAAAAYVRNEATSSSAHISFLEHPAIRSFGKKSLEFMSLDAGREISAAEAMFYILMELRRYPIFGSPQFPACDLGLLLANVITHNPPDTINIIDWAFLPTAVLLSEAGWKINLPRQWEVVAKMPESIFPNGCLETDDHSGSLTAGNIPLPVRRERMELVQNTANGVFLTTWDFLGVRKHDYARWNLIKKGNITKILQLPRFRKQATNLYPALLLCDQTSHGSIRLAKVSGLEAGEGALNQKNTLSLLFDKPKAGEAIDVDKSIFENDPTFNITPAVWLNKPLPASTDLTASRLGDCAAVIRCQLAREKIMREGRQYGFQPDGAFLAKEVGQASLDPQCNFLLEMEGNDVRVLFKNTSNLSKYLLQSGDIIFTFRGTEYSIGNVGFVNFQPCFPTITGTAFYIIRPLPAINPIWLFWYLQMPEAVKEIRARSSGAGMLNINIDDVRNLPVRMPSKEELAEILPLHSSLTSEMEKISMAKNRISSLMPRLARFVAGKKS